MTIVFKETNSINTYAVYQSDLTMKKWSQTFGFFLAFVIKLNGSDLFSVLFFSNPLDDKVWIVWAQDLLKVSIVSSNILRFIKRIVIFKGQSLWVIVCNWKMFVKQQIFTKSSFSLFWFALKRNAFGTQTLKSSSTSCYFLVYCQKRTW